MDEDPEEASANERPRTVQFEDTITEAQRQQDLELFYQTWNKHRREGDAEAIPPAFSKNARIYEISAKDLLEGRVVQVPGDDENVPWMQRKMAYELAEAKQEAAEQQKQLAVPLFTALVKSIMADPPGRVEGLQPRAIATKPLMQDKEQLEALAEKLAEISIGVDPEKHSISAEASDRRAVQQSVRQSADDTNGSHGSGKILRIANEDVSGSETE